MDGRTESYSKLRHSVQVSSLPKPHQLIITTIENSANMNDGICILTAKEIGEQNGYGSQNISYVRQVIQELRENWGLVDVVGEGKNRKLKPTFKILAPAAIPPVQQVVENNVKQVVVPVTLAHDLPVQQVGVSVSPLLPPFPFASIPPQPIPPYNPPSPNQVSKKSGSGCCILQAREDLPIQKTQPVAPLLSATTTFFTKEKMGCMVVELTELQYHTMCQQMNKEFVDMKIQKQDAKMSYDPDRWVYIKGRHYETFSAWWHKDWMASEFGKKERQKAVDAVNLHNQTPQSPTPLEEENKRYKENYELVDSIIIKYKEIGQFIEKGKGGIIINVPGHEKFMIAYFDYGFRDQVESALLKRMPSMPPIGQITHRNDQGQSIVGGGATFIPMPSEIAAQATQ